MPAPTIHHADPIPAQQFPINLDLRGRPCLLVGGGRIATRKGQQLAGCDADLTVVAPEVTPELEAIATRVLRRPYEAGDAAGYRLIITATGDPIVDQQIFDEAEAAGIWVNSADDPERCTFTLPAVVRRGPVLLTASTAGRSPALASWLRARLAETYGPDFADVAADLSARRAEVHASGASTEDINWAPTIAEVVAARLGDNPCDDGCRLLCGRVDQHQPAEDQPTEDQLTGDPPGSSQP